MKLSIISLMLSGVAASMARTEAESTTTALRNACITPQRRRTDAIDVEARVVDDPLLVAPDAREVA